MDEGCVDSRYFKFLCTVATGGENLETDSVLSYVITGISDGFALITNGVNHLCARKEHHRPSGFAEGLCGCKLR